MATKRYISQTGMQYTFPVCVGEKVIWVSFKGPQDDFVTSNEKLQQAIESSQKFKEGQIGLAGMKPSKGTTGLASEAANGDNTGVENDSPEPTGDNDKPAEFPDVTDINGAVAVLRAEPHNVHHLSLRTPEMVREQAAQHKVVFPNWPAQ